MSHHKLIHGGLGHRPLLYEELVLFGFNWIYSGIYRPYVSLGETLGIGIYSLHLAIPKCVSTYQ